MSTSLLPAPIAALTMTYLRLHAQVSSGQLDPSRALTELLTTIVTDPTGVRWRLNSDGLCETSTDGSTWHISDVQDWPDSASPAPQPVPEPPAATPASTDPVVAGEQPSALDRSPGRAEPSTEDPGPDTSIASATPLGASGSAATATTGAADAPAGQPHDPDPSDPTGHQDTSGLTTPAFGGEEEPPPQATATPRSRRTRRRTDSRAAHPDTREEHAPAERERAPDTTDPSTVEASVPTSSAPAGDPATEAGTQVDLPAGHDAGDAAGGFTPNFDAAPTPPEALGTLFEDSSPPAEPDRVAAPDSARTDSPARRSQPAPVDTATLRSGSAEIPVTTGIPLSVLEPPSLPAPTSAPAWAHQLPSAASPGAADAPEREHTRPRAARWLAPVTARVATLWRRAPALVSVVVVVVTLIGASLLMAGPDTGAPPSTSGPDATHVSATLTSLASGNPATVAQVVLSCDDAQGAVTAATFAGLAPAGLTVTAQPGFTRDGAASVQTWWLVSASDPGRVFAQTHVSWVHVGPTWKLASVPTFTGIPRP